VVQGLASGPQAIFSASGGHTCALVNGGVRCWGWNNHGQLGNNSTSDSHVPVTVQNLGLGVQVIAAGYAHTCALIKGAIQCWGWNQGGELGNNATVDSWVPAPPVSFF
jgi:alpha-tubulin suppressor-like RCC1 family protein